MFSLLNLLAFLAVTGYAVYLFINLLYTRYLFIKLGKQAEFEPNLKERINLILINGFGQKKLFKDKKSGLMHLVLFYGFFIIQIGLIELIIKGFIKGYEFPFGDAHKYFSLLQEWATFLMMLAVVYGFYRRYGEKLKRLQWKRDGKAAFVYIALFMLTLSILLTLGFEAIMLNHEPNLVYAPFSGVFALLFGGIGVTAGTVLFNVFWWVHMAVVFTFMVFVPQSKQFHEIFAMINIFFKKSGPVGKLRKIDFEDEGAESFGVGKIEDFTQHQLMDLYACAECGRCTNMCPASGTGKVLSPMDLIVKMRDHLTEKGAAITSRQPWVPAFAFKNTRGNQLALAGAGVRESAATIEESSLIGDVITEEEIWACTTCRNCEDQCPVMNEHVDKIIDLRRYLVLTEGKMNSDAQRAITNIERQGNPWGINKKERENWREGREDLVVPTVKEMEKSGEEFEYLFFVGSMGSYDNRSQKIAQSFARVMNVAGIKFAILGNKEKNSGDTPRRIGNEFLFQELATANIDTFNKHNVKKIVTIDPHAYNSFKNEYPEFGLEAEVYHHTELLYQWIKEGRITFTKELNEVITYHDSCYLGRYNTVYDPPREILKAIPGVKLVETERNRENGMCCGAGGGMMWTEENTGTRINVARTEQLLVASPTMIGTGCPYCLTMISDGVKAKELEESVGNFDIVEIVEKAM
ncbi:(Fe-S)-binding protein [Bacillus sp. B15-48]|uniref:(Fe-S)-binding protein n=1 Tax=Bacillus sp. B15-48 TaxID=1548601 RepID=UPI00193FCB41|nr:(Fe-S)-binding protein [Bacillus sp. B15-48]MBM4765146.1 4Fe-4S dicluster domain-containing protein [Bacillus sp. B15-48]